MTHPKGDNDSRRWQQLMRKSLEGDAAAYHLLLGELYVVVEAYLGRIVGSSPFLEDCVQECLETLHRNRHSYDPNRPFRPWFFTLVRYKAIDFLRSDRARSTLPLSENAHHASLEPSTERQLDAEILLTRLKPIYREAIVLTKLDGYSTSEAAAMIGVTGVAVRTRVHRGLRQLANLLEREVIA